MFLLMAKSGLTRPIQLDSWMLSLFLKQMRTSVCYMTPKVVSVFTQLGMMRQRKALQDGSKSDSNSVIFKLYVLVIGIYAGVQIFISFLMWIPACHLLTNWCDSWPLIRFVKWLRQERYYVGREMYERYYSKIRMRSCILEFDGASSGNPGKSGAGAVLRFGNEVHRFSQGLGTQTNNSAEYQGLLLGMKEAHNKGYDHLEIRGDSKLVCEQFAGNWKVNNPNLTDLRNEALDLKGNFKSVNVQHVPRGSNIEADAQASWGKNLHAGQVEEDYYYDSE